MKRVYISLLFVAFLSLSLCARAQSGRAESAGDGLALLKAVGKRFAEAESYHIEAIEEMSEQRGLTRSSETNLLTAIVAPGGQYRYTGYSVKGGAILVSNGATKWDYHVDEHRYTQSPASTVEPGADQTSEIEFAAQSAMHIDSSQELATMLKSATLLPDEILEVNGHTIPCHLVRYTDTDFRFHNPTNTGKHERRIWIDKSRMVIVKVQGHSEFSQDDSGHDVWDQTILFPVVELDEQEPPGTFVFSPPAGAKLVASFSQPELNPDVVAGKFVGKRAPQLYLKSADGKTLDLAALRGKPVFIDFWATWCGGCVEAMPQLKKLYNETAHKGLAWISIDGQDDAAEAAQFLSQEQIPWPNYHDSDGSLGKPFARQGLPLGVLIDTNGNVVFYEEGYEVSHLRSAIAKLGPEFSSITNTGMK